MRLADFGVQVPHFGPGAGSGAMVDVAQAAEDLGFGSVWVSDHVVLSTSSEATYPYGERGIPPANLTPFYEAIVSLSFVAGNTETVGLGTSVLIAAYRHPMLAAKMLATLDVLSGGRLVLGLGAGWLAEEFELTGAPTFERRGHLLEEIIEFYRAMWTQAEPRVDGEFFQADDVLFAPVPAQAGGPPIWIGGNSDAALRRAARFGDGWHGARLTPEDLSDRVARLHDAVESAGRDPADVPPSITCLLHIEDGLEHRESSRDLVGDPDAVAGMARRLHAAGAEKIVMGMRPGLEVAERIALMETFANEVVPQLTEPTSQNGDRRVR